MGEGLVGSSPEEFSTTQEIFERVFPQYLSIGMTFDEFWNQDCTLVTAYREAEELRERRKDYFLWLQGYYVYAAVGALAPIFHDFAAKGTKAAPYLEAPLSTPKEELEKKKALAERDSIIAWAKSWNARFEEEHGRE